MENKKVLIIDAPCNIDDLKIQQLEDISVVIVDKNIVEINGQLYRRTDKKSDLITDLILPYNIKPKRTLKDINILEEYKLIINKKSNLSKWEREEVIRIFNIEYVKI